MRAQSSYAKMTDSGQNQAQYRIKKPKTNVNLSTTNTAAPTPKPPSRNFLLNKNGPHKLAEQGLFPNSSATENSQPSKMSVSNVKEENGSNVVFQQDKSSRAGSNPPKNNAALNQLKITIKPFRRDAKIAKPKAPNALSKLTPEKIKKLLYLQNNELKSSFNHFVDENKKIKTKIKQMRKEKEKLKKELACMPEKRGILGINSNVAQGFVQKDINNRLKNDLLDRKTVAADLERELKDLRYSLREDSLFGLKSETANLHSTLLQLKNSLSQPVQNDSYDKENLELRELNDLKQIYAEQKHTRTALNSELKNKRDLLENLRNANASEVYTKAKNLEQALHAAEDDYKLLVQQLQEKKRAFEDLNAKHNESQVNHQPDLDLQQIIVYNLVKLKNLRSHLVDICQTKDDFIDMLKNLGIEADFPNIQLLEKYVGSASVAREIQGVYETVGNDGVKTVQYLEHYLQSIDVELFSDYNFLNELKKKIIYIDFEEIFSVSSIDSIVSFFIENALDNDEIYYLFYKNFNNEIDFIPLKEDSKQNLKNYIERHLKKPDIKSEVDKANSDSKEIAEDQKYDSFDGCDVFDNQSGDHENQSNLNSSHKPGQSNNLNSLQNSTDKFGTKKQKDSHRAENNNAQDLDDEIIDNWSDKETTKRHHLYAANQDNKKDLPKTSFKPADSESNAIHDDSYEEKMNDVAVKLQKIYKHNKTKVAAKKTTANKKSPNDSSNKQRSNSGADTKNVVSESQDVKLAAVDNELDGVAVRLQSIYKGRKQQQAYKKMIAQKQISDKEKKDDEHMEVIAKRLQKIHRAHKNKKSNNAPTNKVNFVEDNPPKNKLQPATDADDNQPNTIVDDQKTEIKDDNESYKVNIQKSAAGSVQEYEVSDPVSTIKQINRNSLNSSNSSQKNKTSEKSSSSDDQDAGYDRTKEIPSNNRELIHARKSNFNPKSFSKDVGQNEDSKSSSSESDDHKSVKHKSHKNSNDKIDEAVTPVEVEFKMDQQNNNTDQKPYNIKKHFKSHLVKSSSRRASRVTPDNSNSNEGQLNDFVVNEDDDNKKTDILFDVSQNNSKNAGVKTEESLDEKPSDNIGSKHAQTDRKQHIKKRSKESNHIMKHCGSGLGTESFSLEDGQRHFYEDKAPNSDQEKNLQNLLIHDSISKIQKEEMDTNGISSGRLPEIAFKTDDNILIDNIMDECSHTNPQKNNLLNQDPLLAIQGGFYLESNSLMDQSPRKRNDFSSDTEELKGFRKLANENIKKIIADQLKVLKQSEIGYNPHGSRSLSFIEEENDSNNTQETPTNNEPIDSTSRTTVYNKDDSNLSSPKKASENHDESENSYHLSRKQNTDNHKIKHDDESSEKVNRVFTKPESRKLFVEEVITDSNGQSALPGTDNQKINTQSINEFAKEYDTHEKVSETIVVDGLNNKNVPYKGATSGGKYGSTNKHSEDEELKTGLNDVKLVNGTASNIPPAIHTLPINENSSQLGVDGDSHKPSEHDHAQSPPKRSSTHKKSNTKDSNQKPYELGVVEDLDKQNEENRKSHLTESTPDKYWESRSHDLSAATQKEQKTNATNLAPEQSSKKKDQSSDKNDSRINSEVHNPHPVNDVHGFTSKSSVAGNSTDRAKNKDNTIQEINGFIHNLGELSNSEKLEYSQSAINDIYSTRTVPAEKQTSKIEIDKNQINNASDSSSEKIAKIEEKTIQSNKKLIPHLKVNAEKQTDEKILPGSHVEQNDKSGEKNQENSFKVYSLADSKNLLIKPSQERLVSLKQNSPRSEQIDLPKGDEHEIDINASKSFLEDFENNRSGELFVTIKKINRGESSLAGCHMKISIEDDHYKIQSLSGDHFEKFKFVVTSQKFVLFEIVQNMMVGHKKTFRLEDLLFTDRTVVTESLEFYIEQNSVFVDVEFEWIADQSSQQNSEFFEPPVFN